MKNKTQHALVAVLGIIGLTGMAPAKPSPDPVPAPTHTTTPAKPTPKPTVTPTPQPTSQPTQGGGGGGDMGRVQQEILANHPEIPRAAVNKAFGYLQSHSVANKDYVTIIDFNKPSTEKRMYVVKTSDSSVISYLVAHGKNSGDNYATSFSNISGSNQSSLGIYITGNEYQGGHGRTMILKGMESTNSNAESREIVMHGADYVSPETIAAQGRLGRSWGCPAVEVRYHDELVKELEDGSVYLIYHD